MDPSAFIVLLIKPYIHVLAEYEGERNYTYLVYVYVCGLFSDGLRMENSLSNMQCGGIHHILKMFTLPINC